MKILFVSMPSVHVIRWIENLKYTKHELYWFDILDRGELNTFSTVCQFTDWKKRKFPYVKGENFLKKNVPFLYKKLIPFLETDPSEALEKIIKEIQPDLVHSFEIHHCSYPIVGVMNKYPNLKWLYSCWGSDMFYYQQFPLYLKKINLVLQRIDFLHTDCERDFKLAKQLGFTGRYLGVIPGGTGYKLEELKPHKLIYSVRKIILVKGYQHHLGRGLNVVRALYGLQKEIENYEVVVFGAHAGVIQYIKMNQLDFKVFDRHGLSHQELLELMGKSLIYVGNSISDGMPNTLLEAIVMGAFPIQSNPGRVTEEIIEDGVNGFLIDNPESIIEIKEKILMALSNLSLLEMAFVENEKRASEKLDYKCNQLKVLEMYQTISQGA